MDYLYFSGKQKKLLQNFASLKVRDAKPEMQAEALGSQCTAAAMPLSILLIFFSTYFPQNIQNSSDAMKGRQNVIITNYFSSKWKKAGIDLRELSMISRDSKILYLLKQKYIYFQIFFQSIFSKQHFLLLHSHLYSFSVCSLSSCRCFLYASDSFHFRSEFPFFFSLLYGFPNCHFLII